MERKRSLVVFTFIQFLALSMSPVRMSDAKPTGPIKTIVLLVMENRSFDHFMGLMKKLNPNIDGLRGAEDNPITPGELGAPRIRISDMAKFVDADPGHEYEQVAEQISGSLANVDSPKDPSMDGVVAQAESVMLGLSRRVMSAFHPEVVPMTTALAMVFQLCSEAAESAMVAAARPSQRICTSVGVSAGACHHRRVVEVDARDVDHQCTCS